MTTIAISDRPTGALALSDGQQDWSPRQLAALAQLGLDDVPAADLAVFLHQSQRTGLDPFARQIYMIGRWDNRAGRKKYTIQAAIDGLRIVAERHGQYGGQEGPFYCGEDGKWVDVWVSDKPPVAARVGVVRKDWTKTSFAVAKFSEYAATNRDGKLEPMWANKPCVMIAKCAEALALRKAFPHDLSGIYTSDEMAQADSPEQRIVVDQVADEEPPAIDWDAEIRKCGNSRERLLALHSTAPNDAVKAKIVAAANKAGIAKPKTETPPAKPAEPEPETVDAEIVEDEPTTAKGRLDKAIRDNGWDRDKVEDLFIGQHGAELVDATNEKLIDSFREQLFSRSDADLKATAGAKS